MNVRIISDKKSLNTFIYKWIMLWLNRASFILYNIIIIIRTICPFFTYLIEKKKAMKIKILTITIKVI